MRWEPTGADPLPWSERRSGGETYALGSELRLGPLEAGPTRLLVHRVDKSSGATYRHCDDLVVPPSGELELDFVLEQVEPDRERRKRDRPPDTGVVRMRSCPVSASGFHRPGSGVRRQAAAPE